jgi:GMP synthase-like glutamine amidotransferase
MILVVYFDAFHKDLEKRMGEHNIPFETVKYADLEKYKPDKPITKLIITGSKQRILRSNDFPLLDTYMTQDIHIIGICFGFQLLAYKTGGKVVERPLFRGTRSSSPSEHLYFNHYDRVIELPDTWRVVQRIDGFINVAATDKWIGFQFHPEKYDATFRHYLLPFLYSP